MCSTDKLSSQSQPKTRTILYKYVNIKSKARYAKTIIVAKLEEDDDSRRLLCIFFPW